MEVKKWQEAKRWLTRPKVSPKERADVLQWIDYNNGKFGTEEQAKEYKKKYARAPNKYDESEDPRYVPPEEMIDIKKELKVSPMVKKDKKWKYESWADQQKDVPVKKVAGIKDSALYKLLENPKVLGVELGHDTILEIINLIQSSGVVKKPEIDHIALLSNGDEFIV